MTKKVTISEAVSIATNDPTSRILWRPDPSLPEELQYAVLMEETDTEATVR